MRTIGGLLEVDVGIAKGATGDHVATHPDGKDWSGRRELLEKHGLSDIGMKIADIKWSHFMFSMYVSCWRTR